MHNASMSTQFCYPRETTSANNQASSSEHTPLHVHVEQAINNLLNELDGEPITGLYEAVLAQVEEPLIRVILKHAKTQIEAAKILGISRSTLNKKIKQYHCLD